MQNILLHRRRLIRLFQRVVQRRRQLHKTVDFDSGVVYWQECQFFHEQRGLHVRKGFELDGHLGQFLQENVKEFIVLVSETF